MLKNNCIIDTTEWNKFKLIDDESNHYYAHEFYGKVASVSEILNFNETPEEKARLRKWMHKMDKVHGKNKKSSAIKEDALKRGTKVHKLIENYLLKGEAKEEALSNEYFNAIRPFLEQLNKEDIFMVEQIVGCEKYAGTLDLFCKYRDEIYVVDFTTSKRFKQKKWMERKLVQCAAYANLVNTECKILAINILSNNYQMFAENLKPYLDLWEKFLDNFLCHASKN